MKKKKRKKIKNKNKKQKISYLTIITGRRIF